MKPISLVGTVPVKASARRSLPALVKALQPDADDIVRIDDANRLTIKLDGCDVPRGFHETACNAVVAFCDKHAAAAAILQYDGAALVVGPDGAAKKAARAAHLAASIKALSEELVAVLASPA